MIYIQSEHSPYARFFILRLFLCAKVSFHAVAYCSFFHFLVLYSPTVRPAYRVDRMLSFFSNRPHWGSPTSSHAGLCTPLVPRGGGTLIRGRGVGESQFRRGGRHCGTLWTGQSRLEPDCYRVGKPMVSTHLAIDVTILVISL
jgi:hypothetical protein